MSVLIFDPLGSYELALTVLNAVIGPSRAVSLLDLCCCNATVTHQLPIPNKVYVDVIKRDPPGGIFVQADVLSDHPVLLERYDVVTCLDGIEHLTKEQGVRLIDRMARQAPRQIIFTPLGEFEVEPETSSKWHDPEAHRSGWFPKEFKGWAKAIFPNWHMTVLGIGAFFAWNSPTLTEDIDRLQKAMA